MERLHQDGCRDSKFGEIVVYDTGHKVGSVAHPSQNGCLVPDALFGGGGGCVDIVLAALLFRLLLYCLVYISGFLVRRFQVVEGRGGRGC